MAKNEKFVLGLSNMNIGDKKKNKMKCQYYCLRTLSVDQEVMTLSLFEWSCSDEKKKL